MNEKKHGGNGRNHIPLVDLETHILPGIDNGPTDIGMALDMIALEQEDDVEAIVLTPYFLPDKISIDGFLSRRERVYNTLVEEADRAGDIGIYMKKGAEVRLHPDLPRMDLSRLTIEGTPYLLIELPREDSEETDAILDEILRQGFVPILTHVEKYQYLEYEPLILYDWVCMGALAMIDADSVLDKSPRAGLADQFIAWNIAQLMASDCHNLMKKQPNLGPGYERLLEADAVYLRENAANVYLGRPLDLDDPIEPQLKGNKWR